MEAAIAKAPPSPPTMAPQPTSPGGRSLEGPGAAPTVNSLAANRGAGSKGSAGVADLRTSFDDMRYDNEGATALKPPRFPAFAETCGACAASRGGKRSPGGAAPERGKKETTPAISSSVRKTSNEAAVGADSTETSGSIATAVDSAAAAGSTAGAAHQHTCGREDSGPAFSISITYGMERKVPTGAETHRKQQQQQQSEGPSRSSGAEDQDGVNNHGQLTPVTVDGVGASPGAENDVTPLMSRPAPARARNSGGGGRSRSHGDNPMGESNGEGASGLESVSNSGGGGGGGGWLKRKDTITWEAFLANFTVVDESGLGSTSDSSSQANSRSHSGEGGPRHARRPTAVAESSLRSRYLRAMTSNAGGMPWNNNHGNDEDDDGDEEDGDGASDGVGFVAEVVEEEEEEEEADVEAVELATTSSMPRMVHDAEDVGEASRPKHLDMARSQSLSAVDVVAVHDVRKTMQTGVNRFNVNPKDGIAFLIEEGLIADTAESICGFLSSVEGLSKRRLGDYFGRDSPKAQRVLSLFLKRLNFRNVSLDEALRSMVLRFRLPGEAQQMDRIMERLSERYHEENPGIFSCSETLWVLLFGLMILNTDMYNRNIKESDKMTEAEFVRNHRGIDQGKDLPKDMLEGMYRRVKQSEIRMDEGDMYESEVITFVAPKKSGWLKKKSKGMVGKWKKHWFVLNDGVLYYFIGPQHQDEAPRCIIPLERINIDPVGTTDLSISLRENQGYVKSVKRMDNGNMEQGHHRSFFLRAESNTDRDVWVEALRSEVPSMQMELNSARSLSATPGTSSSATPTGTPSDSTRRTSNKFGSSGRSLGRRRTTQQESILVDKMPEPVIRGWARTQSDKHQTGGRRYIALFRGIGPDAQDVVYFFGDAAMCDKMIGQRLRTSHGCLPLRDVTRVQQRQEEGSGGDRAIALQTGEGKGAKELVIVPEEQREFVSWTRHIKECCPGSAYSIAADGTPITSSIGETAFPSVNTVDSSADGGMLGSIGALTLADHIGIQDEVFVAVGPSGSMVNALGKPGLGKPGGREGSEAYARMESNDTQPASGVGGVQDHNRVLTMPSAETDPDTQTEPDLGAPTTPQDVASDAIRNVRSTREHSTPGTDVE